MKKLIYWLLDNKVTGATYAIIGLFAFFFLRSHPQLRLLIMGGCVVGLVQINVEVLRGFIRKSLEKAVKR